MTLSRFSRVMIGTKTYLDLLIELMSILKTNEFYIVIKHQGLNYRIKAIYDLNLNKLKYPKNFRKVIYDAEPGAMIEDDYVYEISFPLIKRRKIDGCLLYKVKITKTRDPQIYISLTYTDKLSGTVIRCRYGYLLHAPIFNTNNPDLVVAHIYY